MPRSKSRVRIPFPAPILKRRALWAFLRVSDQCFLPSLRPLVAVGRVNRRGRTFQVSFDPQFRPAPSPSGKAEVCKTSIPGSNPGGASNPKPHENHDLPNWLAWSHPAIWEHLGTIRARVLRSSTTTLAVRRRHRVVVVGLLSVEDIIVLVTTPGFPARHPGP